MSNAPVLVLRGDIARAHPVFPGRAHEPRGDERQLTESVLPAAVGQPLHALDHAAKVEIDLAVKRVPVAGLLDPQMTSAGAMKAWTRPPAVPVNSSHCTSTAFLFLALLLGEYGIDLLLGAEREVEHLMPQF